MKRLTYRLTTGKEAAVYIFFALSLVYMELTLKLYCFNALTLRGALYTFLFAVAAGLFMGLVTRLFDRGPARVIGAAMLGLGTLLIMAQVVYYRQFGTFLVLYSIGQAGMVISDFWREALSSVWATLPVLLLLAVPFALFLYWKRLIPRYRAEIKPAVGALALAAAVQCLTIASVMLSDSGVMPLRYLYTQAYVPELAVSNFGALASYGIDARTLISGGGASAAAEGGDAVKSVPEANTAGAPREPSAEPAAAISGDEDSGEAAAPVYGPNVLELDLAALAESEADSEIAAMHRYFASVEPTMENEYTGMFEGKNLIWIVAEAFSSCAVDETLTPTLYKLSSSGFVFTNFYNPVWTVSTSDGEYMTLTGLIPKSGVWSFLKSASNSMPFAFGTMLSQLGYKTLAYHNHNYTYYSRDVSHPNMGYEFTGVGNGLEITEQWPESDLEMIEATVEDYIGDEPFHVYYLTVSGHLEYNFGGNAIAAKNRELVAGLPYSEAARAYLACSIELDRALESLLSSLEEAGFLDDTVIVLSGDHYPYGLTDAQISELLGHEVDPVFERHKSTLILWSSEIEEPVAVDKLCSSLDIMPTLANLFGLDYDSRLVAGRDILSDAEGLVMFSNRSFITGRGRYDAARDSFVSSDGSDADYGYVREVLDEVNKRFEYSIKILDKNYYSYLPPG